MLYAPHNKYLNRTYTASFKVALASPLSRNLYLHSIHQLAKRYFHLQILRSFLLITLLPINLAAQELPPEIESRIETLDTYSSLEGIWEGRYFLKHYPEIMHEGLERDGKLEAGFPVKVEVYNNNSALISTKQNENDEWSILSEEATYISDTLGWHVYIPIRSGFFLERFWFTFIRTTENSADFTMTRTVHNWYLPDPPPEGVAEFYSTFGIGNVERK